MGGGGGTTVRKSRAESFSNSSYNSERDHFVPGVLLGSPWISPRRRHACRWASVGVGGVERHYFERHWLVLGTGITGREQRLKHKHIFFTTSSMFYCGSQVCLVAVCASMPRLWFSLGSSSQILPTDRSGIFSIVLFPRLFSN